MAKLTDNDQMPFGKWQGTKMANVPASYLLWAKTAFDKGPKTAAILEYIEENLDALKAEVKEAEREAFKNMSKRDFPERY